MLTFTKHPILDAKAPTDEEIVALATGSQEDKEILKRWHQQHEARVQLAEEDPIRHGFELEHWKYAEELLGQGRDVMCLGGNRCLAGEQEIWDPVAQKSRRVDEIDGDFHVLAYDESTCQVVQAVAQAPFRKPAQDLFRVQLSNGEDFHCSKTHLARSFGSYLPIADAVFLDAPAVEGAWSADLPLCDGFHLVSILDTGLLASQPNARHSLQTVLGSLSDYRLSLRSRDGQPLPWSSIGLDDSPSLDDVLGRMAYVSGHVGDLASISQHTHLCLSIDLLSILDGPHLSAGQFFDTESDASCTPCKSTSLSREGQEWLQAHQRSIVEFSHRLRSSVLSGPQGIQLHYVCSSGDNRSYLNEVVKCDFLRNDTVWDFTVPEYHNYFIGETLHHNSGKTEFGARAVVKAAIENPNATIICFAQDENASIEVQQSAVYRNLPPEYKKKSKTETEYVNYKVKTGFSGASLILGNGSKILFRKYSQFIANRSAFEGYELGAKNPQWHNIGVWLDEYLEDGDLVETMRFRLATRGAQMLLTFTPIDGYTPFVASYLKDVETKRTAAAELLGGEQVPLIQINSKIDCGIVFFHSILNPFGGYKDIAKRLKHSSRDEILTRAYGIPVKSMTTLFPLFNTSVHVRDDLPSDLGDKSKWTVYHVVDPASARNYVSIWAAVNEKREVVVLREWPDRDTYGPWAEFGDPKWKFGPASKKAGYNVQGYVDLFKEIEHDLGVEVGLGCRIGDSRFFAAENEENVDLFTSFSECGMDFVPSDGRHEDVGITKLDEYFHYNPNVEVDVANKPLMTIHKDCGNTIYSIMNYGQNGKKDEPLKDFIDIPRYLVLANGGEGPMHFGPNSLKQKAQGGAY